MRAVERARSVGCIEVRGNTIKEVDVLDLDPYMLEQLMVNGADGTDRSTSGPLRKK